MTRRKHSSDFKARVALEALRGEVTVAQISSKYQANPSQVQLLKAEALSSLPKLFDKGSQSGAETLKPAR